MRVDLESFRENSCHFLVKEYRANNMRKSNTLFTTQRPLLSQYLKPMYLYKQCPVIVCFL